MKCLICHKPAKYRFSPDLDIAGLGACEKHEKDVQLLYIMLLQGNKEMFDDCLAGLQTTNKN